MIGLFWPHRYNIEECNTWDLTRIGKYHRELLILANRNGTSNASIDLYFNGATNIFRELPKEPTEDIYSYLQKHEQNEIKTN